MIDFELIDRFFRDEYPEIIIDVGAYLGDDVIAFNEYYPDARVLAVECDQSNRFLMKKRLINREIETHNIAICNVWGTRILFYPNSVHRSYGTIMKPTEELIKFSGPYDPEESIPCMTLDFFCRVAQIDYVDILYVTAKGSEGEVIKGFGDFPPYVVYLETKNREFYEGAMSIEEMNEYMKDMGYSLVNKTEEGNLYIER